ncbi:alpha/beta-hydrolase [Cadophora sp. DSE1049]|nr:alpha/beta-hydrolase [Cadophora sp. DSE1049]
MKTNKTYTIPLTGHTYAYIHYPPSSIISPQKPTLLFLHGFPSTSYEWRHQISYFVSSGYGILAPDLLGYGGTSKPLNAEAYIGRSMASEIISLLAYSGASGPRKEVIGIAHDWGTYLLSQLATYHPSTFSKFVFLSGPFSIPGTMVDIPRVNAATKKTVGYEMMGYWLFLTQEGAGKVLADNWEVFVNLLYPADADVWKTHMAPTGVMERFLSSTSVEASAQYLAPWISEYDKRRHHEAFGDGYSACLNWYRREINNLGVKDERELLKMGLIGRGIEKETLMVTALRDAVSSAERARAIQIVDVDAGHWIMLERKDETNRTLEEFFAGNVKGSGPKVNALL